ncbi:MAG: PIN domain-containing protein [Verrucomicrobiaceae bacterium]|nr:PIN domain-containing protein [Verrucomicrobiaceae bacterium]
MKVAVDSSLLIAALITTEDGHDECHQVLETNECSAHIHALAEVFNTLTGSRLGFRVPANEATVMIRDELLPHLTCFELNAEEVIAAFEEAERRGIRGGAVFDYLHLAAAKKALASKLYTLDAQDFRHFHRPGDPDIVQP